MAMHVWDWDWKEKKDGGKSGTYRASSEGLATEADVERYAAAVFGRKLEFVRCRRVGEGVSIAAEGDKAPVVKAVNPEHFMHGTLADLKKDVRKDLGK